MNIEEMMCGLFGEDSSNIDIVKNDGEVVNIVGESFEYLRQYSVDNDT